MTIDEWITKHYMDEGSWPQSDEVVIFRLRDGGIRVMAEMNRLGGVCDDCRGNTKVQINSWRKQKVSWNRPKAGKKKHVPLFLSEE